MRKSRYTQPVAFAGNRLASLWRRISGRRSYESEPGPVLFTGDSFVVPPAQLSAPNGHVIRTSGTDVVMSPAPSTIEIVKERMIGKRRAYTFPECEIILTLHEARTASDQRMVRRDRDYTLATEPSRFVCLRPEVIEISYLGQLQRKDIVSIDPATGEVAITLGREMARHATYWTKAPPAGNIELGRILHRGAQAVYVPTWRWCDGVHVERRPEWESWLKRSRSSLVITRDRLARSLPIRIIAYGDSRTAMGGAYGNNGFINTRPNSEKPLFRRDVPSYFASYHRDLQREFGLHREVLLDFDDGWGPIHVREGVTFRIVHALEQAYPGQKFSLGGERDRSSYHNWGIGGTDSTELCRTDGKSGLIGYGLYPQRWDALKADVIAGATLVILNFGMNEIGRDFTYANLTRMASELKTLGAEVLILSTARPRIGDIEAWRFTCQQTVRAAIETGAAWVDAAELVSPENLVGLGLSEFEISDANYINHDGLSEHIAIAARAIQLLV